MFDASYRYTIFMLKNKKAKKHHCLLYNPHILDIPCSDQSDDDNVTLEKITPST